MNTSPFNEVIDRRNSESVKWHYFDEDVLPLWVADMDFRSPEPVIQALKERVAEGVYGYPREMPELKQAIIHWLDYHYNWLVRPEEIVLTPGVVLGFQQAIHAIGKPGDGVLVQTPVYFPFLTAPQNAARIRQDAPLTLEPDHTYSIDLEQFESTITDKTRMFLLCSPHNPVGRVFRKDELERMAEICLRHNLVICSDEIHADLIYSDYHHIPTATLSPEIADRTITLMAPSKTFNIAGLGCSFAVIPNADLRKQYIAGAQGLVGHVNLLGQVAAAAAYREGQPWLDELMAYLEGNRDFLMEYVRQELPGVEMAKPEGTYLAWLDCRKLELPDLPGCFFLKEARVGLNEGKDFGGGGEGFVRLNFGCPRATLQEALDRMKTALRNQKG